MKVQRCEQYAQQDLGSELRVNEQVIPPDEAQTGPDSEGLLRHGRGIHADFVADRSARFHTDESRQFPQQGPDERVVVFILGVRRDPAGTGVVMCRLRLVVESDNDHRFGAFPEPGWVEALVEVAVHVLHPAGIAGPQPCLEMLDVLRPNGRGVRDAHGIETEFQRLVLNLLFRAHDDHYTIRGVSRKYCTGGPL